MTKLELLIEDELEQALDAVAHDMRRPKGWVINEALREYLRRREQERQRWQDTLEALEDIRMGRVVDGDKVHAWLESRGTDDELSTPIK